MKHLLADSTDELLRMALQVNVRLAGQQTTAMVTYLDEIIEINGRINLTRITNSATAVRLHLVDSLVCLPEVNAAPFGDLLDLGAGAGFPGVPIAIASTRHGVLLDSVGKKMDAVQIALEAAGLTKLVDTKTSRSEDLARELPGAFNLITARAVASLSTLLELASPLLAAGGRLIALKGSLDSEELESARSIEAMTGLSQLSLREVALPEGGERRTIVSYEKCGPATVELPRRPGQAQRCPLSKGVR